MSATSNLTDKEILTSLRKILAVARILLCFSLLYFLTFFASLCARTYQMPEMELDSPLPPAGAPASQIPFLGITVALEQYSPAERSAVLDRLSDTGFGWVRQRFDWSQLEPQPGAYVWQESDDLLQAIANKGLVPVAVLDGSPAWARAPQDTGAADNPLAPPADPATFARFAGAFAARYGQYVRFYQIWDEPNIAPHWGARYIEPVNYALLLKAAAQAIRAADPDAVILIAALAPTTDRGHTAIDENYFLERLYAAGAGPYFDATAVQAFGFASTSTDGRVHNSLLNFQRVRLVRRTMLAAGDGTTPIWIIRYGWNTHTYSPWRTVTPETQTVFAVTALDIAYRQWPWLVAMGWMVYQPARPPDDPAWGFALTPELATAIQGWQQNAPTERPHHIPVRPPPLRADVLLYIVSMLVLWRGVAAGRLLPWATWLAHYRAWSPIQQGATWAVLMTIYILATWPPLIVLCWACAAFLVLAQPLVGLGLAVCLLPFYYSHKEVHLINGVWTVPPAFALLLVSLPALIAQSAGLIKRIGFPPAPAIQQLRTFVSHTRQHIQFSSFDALALLFLAISLQSGVYTWRRAAYHSSLAELVLYPLLLYVSVRCFTTTQRSHFLVTVCAFAGGIFVAILGLAGWLRGAGIQVDGVLRLVGPYYSPNHTALYLIRILFIGLGITLAAGETRVRTMGLLANLIVLAALILTGSRGAWLLGLPAGVAFCILWWRLKQQGTITATQYALVGLSITVIAALAAIFLLPGSRLSNSATIASRLSIWRATWQLWLDHWLVGVGPGGFFWHYPAYLTQFTNEPNIIHPHNVWLESAVTWGVGGCFWLLILLVLLVRVIQQITPLGSNRSIWLVACTVAGLIAALAHAQVDTFLSLPDLAAWNWLVLGLLANAKRVLIGSGPSKPNTPPEMQRRFASTL